MQQQLEQLREIRELEAIPDISFYFFIAMVAVALLFVGALIYMVLKLRQKRKANIRKEVLRRLREITFDDSKKAAYAITKYGRYLADEERSQKLFAQLLPRLEKYKFVPDPPPFDTEDMKYYDLFVESVDE